MQPLKNQFFNPVIFLQLTDELAALYPPLDRDAFFLALTENLAELELKERLRRTVEVFHAYLPTEYRTSVELLKQLAPSLGSFTGIAIADFIGAYGQHDIEFSLNALHYVTRYASAEFAIREFLRIDFDQTMQSVIRWSKDDNEHVRRLASEGTRPRLPWSFQLKALMADPHPVKPILDNLKADPSPYVRKSVANHLNDISKDHPDTMLDWVTEWDHTNPHTTWIVKHSTRTLIKAGHPRAFAILGFEPNPRFRISNISLSTNEVSFGGQLTFKFTITSEWSSSQKLAVDFAIHFMKKNGTMTPKVFKLKEFSLGKNQTLSFSKRVDFQERSTRKYYPGQHRIEIIVNGNTAQSTDFEVAEPNQR